MFCSSCGTPNEDGTASCRMCGESMVQGRTGNKTIAPLRKWLSEKAKWLSLVIVVLLAAGSFAVYYYRASEEFEVTGELLYKNELRARPIIGAQIRVFERRGKGLSPNSRYQLLLSRQSQLRLWPEGYNTQNDVEFAPLGLDPLSKMDWTWWEGQRLFSCGHSEQLFREGLRYPAVIASTSTDMNGHFWLKLKRGQYFITAESQVPSFWRLEDPMHPIDTSRPVEGTAFWSIAVAVTGNLKVVSADPDCSPDR